MSVKSLVTGLSIFAAFLAITPVAAEAILTIGPYLEVGDAGDLTDPQIITGGPYDGIAGALGAKSPDDLVDVFGFYWAGGTLAAEYASPIPLWINLYDAAKSALYAGGGATTGGAFPITFPGLAAGNYFLEVMTTAAVDPPFTFTLTGPTTGTQNIIQAFSVPAPPAVALVLLGLGLAALGARRRR